MSNKSGHKRSRSNLVGHLNKLEHNNTFNYHNMMHSPHFNKNFRIEEEFKNEFIFKTTFKNKEKCPFCKSILIIDDNSFNLLSLELIIESISDEKVD
jgi:PleD family two-component response regulator